MLLLVGRKVAFGSLLSRFMDLLRFRFYGFFCDQETFVMCLLFYHEKFNNTLRESNYTKHIMAAFVKWNSKERIKNLPSGSKHSLLEEVR